MKKFLFLFPILFPLCALIAGHSPPAASGEHGRPCGCPGDDTRRGSECTLSSPERQTGLVRQANDEFLPWSPTDSSSAGAPDEEDVFAPLDQSPPLASGESRFPGSDPGGRPFFDRQLKWAVIALSLTVLAGLSLRFKVTRNLRALFLLSSLIVLGFYNGACPCPIQSFMNLLRIGIGKCVNWRSLVYFLALLPISYLLGRVWCGWVCHLGALQEFLFLSPRFNFFRSDMFRIAMRISRYLLLLGLIIWVVSSGTAIWCRYDPFRVAFTLTSANLAGWILLTVLLSGSLFIYRPFCRAACPIGAVLDWLDRIPGASLVDSNAECIECPVCGRDCKIDLAFSGRRSFILDKAACIACGDCIDACPREGREPTRKRTLPGKQ
ncbi:MAG: 4Fe-4S binding protein [Candidatus Krumholzibacteriota bacterium]|nr:4Fe-4S binding protein [Candidatus Krumholzibacteriota bacterium]